MDFTEWSNEVNRLGWGDSPPTVVPRYVFALYVAGYYAGMSPQQFQTFMSARAFVNTATVPLANDKIALARANDFIQEWEKRTDVKKAVPKLLRKEEVQEQYHHLFDGTAEEGLNSRFDADAPRRST